MILPTKYVPVPRALISVSAAVLECLTKPMTVSQLWEETGQRYEGLLFERFILATDLLYIMGAVEMNNGLIEKKKS
ncbi:hypothetical protein CPA56_02865 [Bombella sp. TMW2.1889]|uniref:Uncharacterized protein n=2 Tax=Bombella mellum TaxID=2039288 RepID=A0ABR5ZRI0_9PROT|nr:hypothetical protein [Bombella mellum]